MLLAKLFFFHLESSYASSFLGVLEISFYLIAFSLAIILFFRNLSKKLSFSAEEVSIKKNKFLNKFNLLTLFFVVTTLAFVFMSFDLNFSKKSIHWDAVALYDARAKFLSYGMKFSDMPTLSKYDNLNQYYYLLYPPYTSIAHYLWRAVPVINAIPVSVYYSLTLLILTLLTFLIGKERFGLLGGVVLAFLVASNNSIFNVAIKEYTNLPFDLYLIGGIFLLYSYMLKDGSWKYMFGFLMIASSLWIRLLEPIWLGIIIAFAISVFSKREKSKSFFLIGFLCSLCLLEYYSWTFFTGTIARNPGFLNITKLSIVDTFVGLFTGAPFVVAATVIRSWGVPFFIHLTALVGCVLRPKYLLRNRSLLFLFLVVLMSMLIYFSEFYGLSFQEGWWSIVAMSIDRSSTFLIPISAFILIELIFSSRLLKRIFS
jgi:hypothetical protein